MVFYNAFFNLVSQKKYFWNQANTPACALVLFDNALFFDVSMLLLFAGLK